MSRSLRRYSGADEAQVDMTPMLDIVFILLIFFIVTATFLDVKAMALTEPAPSVEPAPPSRALQVYVDSKDIIAVDGLIIEPSALPDYIQSQRAERPNLSIILRSDSQASHGMIVALKDSLDQASIPSVLKVDRR
jgi:biopolymer transport protein ExbD